MSYVQQKFYAFEREEKNKMVREKEIKTLADYLNKYILDKKYAGDMAYGASELSREITAAVGDVSQPALSTWTTGKRLPSYEQAANLVEFFQDKTVWVLCGYAIPMPEDPELLRIAEAWAGIPEKDREKILTIVSKHAG